MPRADQSIRQWTILKLLEANKRITLRQIGDALANPCHERTLRRDLDALSLAGFPLYSEREDGKRYWKLLDRHKTVPFPLTPTELYALQCGRHFLAPLEGTFVSDSIERLYQKIDAHLTPENRAYLTLLQQTLQIGIPPYTAYQSYKAHIDRIRTAIEQGKVIELRYTALRSARSGPRKVNPYGLWYYDGALYLVGHCHKRRNLRTFAVERISAVKITEARFQIPFYFSIGDYFKDAFGVYRGEAEGVVLRFDKPASLWVRSRRWHASQQLTRLPREKIELAFQVAVTPELMQWVLSFGAQVEVIAPKRLKTMIENEAWRLLGRYQKVKMGRKKKVLKK
ncbi:MAG: helix-turn-helix transcriptional regulator [Nitrospiria bacterium]